MRLFLGLLLFLNTSLVMGEQALPVNRLVCATYHLTTTYALFEHPNQYELQVIHHEGVERIPVHDGIITTADFPYIEQKSEVFRKLGSKYPVFFDKSECTFKNEELKCFGQKPMQLGQVSLTKAAFTLTKKYVKTSYTEYNAYTANFSFTTAGDKQNYTIPMEYEAKACTFH